MNVREQYKAEINKAFPHLNDFFVNILLDLYFADGGKEKVEQLVKADKKKQIKKKKEEVEEQIVEYNGVDVMNPTELISIE
jgi:hypothetical protein